MSVGVPDVPVLGEVLHPPVVSGASEAAARSGAGGGAHPSVDVHVAPGPRQRAPRVRGRAARVVSGTRIGSRVQVPRGIALGRVLQPEGVVSAVGSFSERVRRAVAGAVLRGVAVRVVAVPPIDFVGAVATVEAVVSVAPVHPVDPGPATDDLAAAVSVDDVRAVSALELLAVPAGQQGVGTADHVVAATPFDPGIQGAPRVVHIHLAGAAAILEVQVVHPVVAPQQEALDLLARPATVVLDEAAERHPAALAPRGELRHVGLAVVMHRRGIVVASEGARGEAAQHLRLRPVPRADRRAGLVAGVAGDRRWCIVGAAVQDLGIRERAISEDQRERERERERAWTTSTAILHDGIPARQPHHRNDSPSCARPPVAKARRIPLDRRDPPAQVAGRPPFTPLHMCQSPEASSAFAHWSAASRWWRSTIAFTNRTSSSFSPDRSVTGSTTNR